VSELALSNRVDLTTTEWRTPSSLSLTRIVAGGGAFDEPVGPAACFSGGGFVPLANPLVGNTPIDPSLSYGVLGASMFHGGEPLFVRLVDADQNLDSNRLEWVVVSVASPVSGDSEQIRLTETGPDTGVFAGYVPTAASQSPAADCVLQVTRDSSVEVSYTDVADSGDQSLAEGWFDPVSRVFHSETGQPVSGARVTLVDAATGQPVAVLGDDGMSTFPATVTSGATVTDSAGTVYAFGPGEFRFPIVPSGRYRLEIEPPEGFAAPSNRSEPQLQSMAAAPFALGPGAFGQAFDVSSGPVLNVDVPLDPTAGALFLEKRTLALSAAPGDFIEYQLTLSHGPARAPQAVAIDDLLPPGFRYMDGSTRLGGAPLADPQIAPDGRRLRFDLGSIAPDETVSLRYVAAVTPGAPRGEAVNVAQAAAIAGVSNEARATVQIVEDLFRNESLLVGRVLLGSCTDALLDEGQGLAGARVYLEDGRYAVTDAGGRFHFEGLPPGTHVAQLDVDSLPLGLEIAACDLDPRFAGRAHSRFVELRPGGLGRADFYVRPPQPRSAELSLSLEQSIEAGEVRYALELSAPDPVTTEDVQVMVMLPDGIEYLDGSGRDRLENALQARTHGAVLTFDLGARAGPWEETLRFQARVAPDARGELPTRALARFRMEEETAQTPAAETAIAMTPGVVVAEECVLELTFGTLSATLSAGDRAQLDALAARWTGLRYVHIDAAGHTDDVPIAPRSRHLFADNHALSEARAAAVAEYLRGALSLAPDQTTHGGFGADRPVADNRSAEGRGRNRRVELGITGIRDDTPPELGLVRGHSGPQAARVTGAAAALPEMAQSAVPAEISVAAAASEAPDFDVHGLEPGLEWLWPPLGHAPPIPSIRVIIQHAPSQEVELELNGRRVSPLNFEGREGNMEETVAVSRWRGLDLADGPNELRARVLRDGITERVLEQTLHFAGPPVRGELVEGSSYLVADGTQRPALAIRFVDRWGQPARLGTVGGFDVEPPFRAWWEVERLRENPLTSLGDSSPTYRVGEDGIAFIELEPTTRTGQVLVDLLYPEDRLQEIRAWLKPEPRDWILVGLAQGTVGYNKISGEMQLAEGAGFDEEYYDQGRLAFFAKGRIRGSALLTVAFDTEGDRDEASGALGGVIDPDRYYTLYGDGTEQRFDAPSRERLYLKIEREAFVALFGDYDTGLTVTELGRYSRTFNGLKSEYHGERFSYSAFASQTDQAFVKDELRGDGTSGPYRLSRQPILANSDKIAIEVRDRFRPERTLVSRTLDRHFDYDIDYTLGTLYFKEPVASRDFGFNPVYIVADYESRDARENATVAGGRAAVKLGDERAELGLTLIREGVAGAEGELLGTDLRYRFNDDTELKAELAVSEVEGSSADAQRRAAYLVELNHRRGQLETQAYIQEQETGFGLGQQRGSAAGTRRSGVDLRAQLNPAWLLNAEAFRQETLDEDATRTVVEGETRYQDGWRTANLGLRQVAQDSNGEALDTSQAFVGGTWRFMEEFLTARVNLEKALSGDDAISDYPSRTVMGLDAAVNERVSVFGEYELTDGRDLDGQMARVGVKANPTDRTQIDSSVNQRMTEYGPRTFASLGLIQGWHLGERWTMDVGAEHSNTLREPELAAFDPAVPLASGSLEDDFSVGYLGAAYRAELWSFTSRLEYRNSDSEDRIGLIGGFYREQEAGRGFSAELRLLDTRAMTGLEAFDGSLRLGWAYRPAASRWIVFDRVDWIHRSQADRSLGIADSTRSQRFVNNLNAHLQVNPRQELELQYAAKYVRSNFQDFTATGFLDLIGFGWRHHLTGRLGFGIHGSWYRAAELGVTQRGIGVDVGVNVATNLQLRIGYNFSGFEDEDFSRNRYTAEGPFVSFSLKADQASLRDLLRR
jgi:flagellar motor protein MotB